MNHASFSFHTNPSMESIELSSGIKFTAREIDIIACIVSGRGGKATAALLSIAEKTVETHARNIMRKLECNSQESIRDHIEKSGKLILFKDCYINLLVNFSFQEHLKKIRSLSNGESPSCYLIYWPEQNPLGNYIPQLEKHLNIAGIKVSLKPRSTCNSKSYPPHPTELQAEEHILYICPEVLHPQTSIDELAKEDIHHFIQMATKSPEKVIFLLSHSHPLLEEVKATCIDLRCLENYYMLAFLILQKMLTHIDVDKFSLAFLQQYEASGGHQEKILLQQKTEPKSSIQEQEVFVPSSDEIGPNSPLIVTKQQETTSDHNPSRPYLASLLHLFKLPRISLRIGIIGCFAVVGGTFLITQMIQMSYVDHKETNKSSLSIRSDLPLPTGGNLVQRTQVLQEIKEKLNGNKGIQTIALVGIGGAGKTTTARQYAHSHNASLVWEVNAETKESLLHGFESLAYSLVEAEEDKRTLREIEDIKNPTIREEKIIQFIKAKLIFHPGWILIYDNVEKFTDIFKYFPQDSLTWGQGKVILTTRDENIQNNNFINEAIHIGELTPAQKLGLFSSIMNHGSSHSLLGDQVEETKAFLEKLPSFPLDVSVAAYYLKATNTPYATYLKNLKTCGREFENIQQHLLKEAGNYIKTRYGILTLSFQHILNSHPEFKDLLLFVSLLDSQNIPKDLLKIYKNDTVVDSFIVHLKKYSLLLNDPQGSSSSLVAVSFHRSTQEIIRTFLSNELNIGKNKRILQFINNELDRYVAKAIDTDDIPKMRLLISHCKAFLEHDFLGEDILKGSILANLGIIYSHLGYNENAKEILDESLINISSGIFKDKHKIAWFLSHLGNFYRESDQYVKAKELLEQSLRLYKQEFPKDYEGIARALTNLGEVYREVGDIAGYKEAEKLFEQALLIYKQHLPKNHNDIARTLTYLGNTCRRSADYQKAINFLRKGLTIYRTLSPDNHIGFACALAYLGNTYRAIGDFAKARDMLEKSLAIYHRNFGEKHYRGTHILVYLSHVYEELGDYRKAKELLEKSLKINRKCYPEQHVDTAWTLAHLGNICAILGDYKNAKVSLEKSLSVYKACFPKGHPDTAYSLTQLGNLYRDLGKNKEGRNFFERAMKIYEKSFFKTDTEVVWAVRYLGNFYKIEGNYEKAKEVFAQGLAAYKKLFPLKRVHQAKILRDLGQVYVLEGQFEIAEKLINESLKIFQQHNHPESYSSLESLADLYVKRSLHKIKDKSSYAPLNLNQKAMDYLNQALKIAEAHFPKHSLHIERLRSKLKKLKSTIAY